MSSSLRCKLLTEIIRPSARVYKFNLRDAKMCFRMLCLNYMVHILFLLQQF